MGTIFLMDTSAYFEKLNLNPDGKDISDCSTRSLCYCLKMDYSELRKMQEGISLAASGTKANWNSFPVLETIILIRNWDKATLVKKIPRYKLAGLLKWPNVRILTESSQHACPIHNGKVVDTWDSTRGRVSSIIFQEKYRSQILKRLDDAGIQSVVSG